MSAIMPDGLFSNIGFDRYDWNARLRPALFALLPALLLPAVWFGQVWTVYGSLVTLLTTSGLTYLLARLARFRGRALETRLVNQRGGQPSLLFLRHRDTSINAPTKQRYHALLRSRGLPVSSKEEEAADPTAADGLYQSAVDWLLEQTRDTRKFSLLLNENIDYGFRRNLLGLKPIALVVSVATFFANILLLWTTFGTNETRVLAGDGLGVGLAAIILVWIFWIDERFVEDSAASYAKRLLAQLENLSSSENQASYQNKPWAGP
jgi:hypothetical protein